MRKATPLTSLLVIATFTVFLFSCNSTVVDIPFPVSDSGYPQPVTQPLVLTPPKKLNWVTIKTGKIIPTVRKFDLKSLPSTPYDPTGFQPFKNAPEVSAIDFKSLPDSTFDLEKVPSASLQMKKYVLAPPVVTKAGLISPKNNATMGVSDWGVAMGLQGQNMFCLLKDKHGLIWLSTNRGIYRYDGEYVQGYLVGPASAIIEDREGRIWYGSDNGFGYLDTRHGITAYTNGFTIPFPRVPKMMMDDKGRIWVPQVLHGIYGCLEVVDPATETFRNLTRTAGISGSFVWGVCQEDRNNFWLATNDGIDIIRTDKGKISYIKRSAGLDNDTARAIANDGNGHIWVAYKNGQVDMFDPAKNTLTKYVDLRSADNVNMYYYRFLFDKNGIVWIATRFGLLMLDPKNNLIRHVGENEGIQRSFILDLLDDGKDRTLVATNQLGLFLVDQDAKMVYPVGKKTVSTMYSDETGKLWVGTNSNGIIILDPEKKSAFQLDKQAGININNIIQSIQNVNGQIWITSDGGLDKLDLKRGIAEHSGKKEGFLTDTTYNVLKDSRGYIWVTGPSEGIELIDSARNIIQSVRLGLGLSDNTVSHVKEDRQGLIWIATQSGGVDVIDPADWSVRYLNNLPGLKDTCYRVLLPDKYGRTWIGTDKGIYVADIKNNTITSITTKEGLSDNYVTSLKEYKGDVVAGTYHKVNLISAPVPANDSSSKTVPGKWTVSTLANSEGLVQNSTGWDVHVITPDGKYAWGDAGVTLINEIKPETDSAVTYITGMNVMNQNRSFINETSLGEKDSLRTNDTVFINGQKPVGTGYVEQSGFYWDSVSGPYNMPENLVIPYDQNYLQFQFAQLHKGRQEPTQYSYILLGIDKHWSAFETKTVTDNYLNLPPGNYTFKVTSKSASGYWGKPAALSFTISPPWWNTWWAYALYVVLLVSVLWAFVHYRSKKLLSENRLLEDRVEERTKEVKQQAEELATVAQISQALVSQADLHDLIKLVGDELRDLFKANIVYVALLDKKTKIISFPYQYGDSMQPLKLGEGLTSKIILSGEPLLINKDVHEMASSLGIGRVGIPAASYLGVPIPVADEIIGVLSIQSTEMENRFVEKDKRLLGTIAANVGVAIRKARLFEEVKLANTDADIARKNAEEANAAKSAFLSTVSHELRTPLTSVLGFAKITKKRLEEKIFPITDRSDPKTAKTIEQISGNLGVVISEGERLTNLINDVLDLAKIEAGKMEWNMEPVRINEVVERAIAATSALFDQKNLKLERKIEDGLPEVSGDRDKLIQVVVNLLSNAVKFTNEGAVTCRVFMKDHGIVVGITDTGIGIAPEDHAKVFEQFKQVGDTLTDKPKGTGLGLPICKEIVEHHDGKIWLESELGKGSTFYFMLPVISEDEKNVRHIQLDDLVKQLRKRMEYSHPSTPADHSTILVVDDDEGIRSLLRQELTDAGYHVDEAVDGKDAIAKIRVKRPDLVILDVMMPEMNGFDVAAIMKNDPQTMEIPIIILSVVQDKSRGFRIGVDRYLTKPIDTDLLFSEIGNLLEQGKSRKKIMVVDEDSVTIHSLTDVLEAKGYQVVESDAKELVENAIAAQPDIIILNSLISGNHEIVRSLRFEKGLENVLFLIYQ
jgi:signal transduction histidine kinase/CheY-like chemotaxis protein/ligand-binding sensor domain-containing protein